MSLKARLTLFAAVLMLLTLTVIGLVSYHYVANTFAMQLDAALEDRAGEVLEDLGRLGPNLPPAGPIQIASSPRPQTVPVYVELIDHLDTLRYSSPGAGRLLAPPDKSLLHQVLKGATITRDEGGAGGPARHVRYSPVNAADRTQSMVLVVGTPLGSTDNALAILQAMLVSSALLSAGLVGLGVWLAASRTLAAVDRVSRTARTIEVSQRLDQRIPQDGRLGDDEMSRLVRTFNNMLERISASFDAQRQFVADSSHELRSPLTVIRGNLDLLRRTQDAAERNAITRLIEDEAARMSRLVDNLLFLAQVEERERAGAPLDRRPVELDSLLLTVYQQARSMTDRHAILLGDEDAICIDGDRDQLQQLLLNLVDNAIKYTPAGGRIVLSLRREGPCALLEVRDSGLGIPQEDLPHIFDRFYRVDKARSRRAGGAGLGLSIVQGIAASHGGSVSVASVAGQGSTFQVRLPCPADPGGEPPDLPVTGAGHAAAVDVALSVSR